MIVEYFPNNFNYTFDEKHLRTICVKKNEELNARIIGITTPMVNQNINNDKKNGLFLYKILLQI